MSTAAPASIRQVVPATVAPTCIQAKGAGSFTLQHLFWRPIPFFTSPRRPGFLRASQPARTIVGMALSTDLTALIPRWRIDGTDMLPPNEPEQIEALFAQLGQPATAEVVTLYTTLGGMTTMDGDFWRMWSLEEISRANQGQPSEWGVQFADFLTHSQVFRLRTAADGCSEVFAGPLSADHPPVRVAASLDEFFALYRSDPDRVLQLR